MAAFLVLACLSALPVALAQTNSNQGPANQGPANQGPPAQGAEHHAMHHNQNLQVLPQDISGPELMKVMHTFEAQVGVECGFCHASDAATHRLDFASDVKPEKATARVMMHMTRDINEKYLTQINDPDHADHPAPPVSCGTCHRGQSMPASFTPPPAMTHGPGDHHDADDHHAPPA
ncbi:MAG TPA: c-type cytochrome [Acidisarcina sp.]